MQYIPNTLFLILLTIGTGFFAKNFQKIIRNIKLGQDIDRKDNPKARWRNMAMIALGQSKMVKRPVAGILHIVVYVGFIIINIELLEIIIDGLFGTHRCFSGLGTIYTILIATFEILAVLVLVAVIIFWTRRNVIKLKRLAKIRCQLYHLFRNCIDDFIFADECQRCAPTKSNAKRFSNFAISVSDFSEYEFRNRRNS
jgi:hypothetical protein